jgi:NDP-sugar pyrophosphorylase family protein
MKAMILAAGLGTRLEPLTVDRAKPTLTVLDEPVILTLVRMIASQGIREVVVNTHAHPESVHEALRDAPCPVAFSHEEHLLRTGGGIRAARRLLGGQDPFLILNGDMLIDLDLAAIQRTHRTHGAVATLGLREDPRKDRFGTLGYDRRGTVTRITDLVAVGPEESNGLFVGVHLVEPEVFGLMPDTPNFDIVRHVYVPELRNGAQLAAFVQPPDARWVPVGTPADLLDANLAALSHWADGRAAGDQAVHIGAGASIRGELEAPVWIGAQARVGSGARVGPGVILGTGAQVGEGARLERVVVLSGSRLPPGRVLRDAVVGPGGVGTRE